VAGRDARYLDLIPAENIVDQRNDAPILPDVTDPADADLIIEGGVKEHEPIGIDVPRPANWGGYRLWVESVELWVEGEYRLHDRARWTRTLTPVGDGQLFHATPWHATRLQP